MQFDLESLEAPVEVSLDKLAESPEDFKRVESMKSNKNNNKSQNTKNESQRTMLTKLLARS